MQIAKDSVVSIDYTLRSTVGEVLDSSQAGQPLTYLQGHSNIIPGLERALEGKNVGDAVSVTVPPEDAYGLRSDELVQSVPKNLFSGAAEVKAGMQFRAQTQAGPRVVTVVGVEGETVTVDANHPLAGQTLKFDVTIVAVRAATEEELSHGHAHGPDGHHSH